MKKIVSLALLLLIMKLVDGQIPSLTTDHRYPAKGTRRLQLDLEHGGVLPVDDNPKVNYLLRNSQFTGVSLKYSRELGPSSIYRNVYRRPMLGFGLMAATFCNPVIGTPMSVLDFWKYQFQGNLPVGIFLMESLLVYRSTLIHMTPPPIRII